MDAQIVFLLVNISIVFSVFHSVSSDRQPQLLEQSKLSSTPSAFNIHLPLSPLSSGVHSLSLSFGTLPQALPFVMDTSNSLVFFRCRDEFSLDSKNNSFPCNSTQCNWFHPNQQCRLTKRLDCPDFHLPYDSGEISLSLQSENLTFPEYETSLDNFIVGCIKHSSLLQDIPMGIAGFGHGPYSLPAQLELDTFSYCMVSHIFDENNTISSDLVLTKGAPGSNGSFVPTEEIVHYTPFIPNPESRPDYYYVRLQNIKVGNVNITVPDEYQVPDKRSGHGGTIVNSGTPYNFMDDRVFNLVADEFERQVTRKNSNNIRNTDAEGDDATGFGLCFNVSSFDDIPTLSLHFDGGAIMDLPLGNYFTLISDIDEVPYVVCMMTKTALRLTGPTIVLGNYVQQNFFVEFDLKNNRLGLLNHTCTQK